MPDCRNLLITVAVIMTLVVVFIGCGGTPEPTPTPTPAPTSDPTPEPSPATQELAGKIAGIDPAKQAAFPELLGTLRGLDGALNEGTVTEEERTELEKDLSEKFSDFIKHRVDEIDPTDPASLKDFFDLQTVQRLSEYDKLCAPETKQYKEEQMGEKFNEWVRNRVDEIDPADPNSLKYFFWLQTVQRTDKYDEFATPETHEYKEEQMREKFNEFIENRVNELDPNDPNFLEELEKLRVLQRSDKYDRLCTTLMHEWKEQEIKDKFSQFITNLVDSLNPLLPNFMKGLGELTDLQKSDIYEELCPKSVKEYKEAQLVTKLAKAPGEIPNVVGSLPLNTQTGVPVSQSILIAFDQPMIPPSVEPAIEISPSIDYVISWFEEGVIAILQPLAPLEHAISYKVSIGTEAMSIYGMPLEEGFRFSFTTKESGGIPQVVETSPFDGQFDASGSQPFEIIFDQPMDTVSVEAAIEISPDIDYAVIWREEDTLLMLQPLAPLGNDTAFTVNIAVEALSADGLPLEEDYNFSFFTGIHGTPHVLGTMPLDGEVDIPLNHPIQIIFDRSMDTASVEAVLIVSPALDYTTTWFEADFVLMLEPVTTVATYTGYTIQIGDGAMSVFGMPLEESYSFSFATSE